MEGVGHEPSTTRSRHRSFSRDVPDARRVGERADVLPRRGAARAGPAGRHDSTGGSQRRSTGLLREIFTRVLRVVQPTGHRRNRAGAAAPRIAGAVRLATVPQKKPGRSTLAAAGAVVRSEEHTSELQSQSNLVCRLLLEKKKKGNSTAPQHAC